MISRILRRLGHVLINIVFPNVCPVCGRTLVEGETTMCLHCRCSLPTVSCVPYDNNSVHQHLASSVPIDLAATMFTYKRGDVYVRLIHQAKYNSRPKLARQLGREFASKLSRQHFFDSIDAILPVPMHWWKRIRRGYNQSEVIARGIADVASINVISNVLMAGSHSSQTRHSRSQRWQNATSSYYCSGCMPRHVTHLLIVDDVITTGATMLACCKAIHDAYPHIQISALSLAMTSRI
ncbi:MAG: hypothetical protein NC343_08000 [Muribaculum sp.]|nr:hypothetical protein [Muribaculaceae bacterium]MCM1081678.1 hypothetical protein [Muribaculum sp.]